MALADALHGLLGLPGATYACVVERDSGRLLAEVGRAEGGTGDHEGAVPHSVVRWGTALAALFDSTPGDALDDVMVTGRRSYHLVRALGADAGPDSAVLVYLRLDRARANLAAARRELANVRLGVGAPAPAPARPGPARAEPPARPGPARTETPGAGYPPRAHHAITESRSARVAAEVNAAREARASRGATADDLRSAARHGAPPTEPGPSGGPAPVGRAPAAPGPGTQIPLPRRTPAPPPVDALRRRRDAAVPDGFVPPATLGHSWAKDAGTLRRLIAGLRRMG